MTQDAPVTLAWRRKDDPGADRNEGEADEMPPGDRFAEVERERSYTVRGNRCLRRFQLNDGEVVMPQLAHWKAEDLSRVK